MAGTINLSLTQQFDMNGAPLSGGFLYTFVSGTSTPQSAFQDAALTLPFPNPISLDASGRVPAFYLADGSIKIRLADKNGNTVVAADQLLVIGPSSGAASSSSFDPTAVMATGDIKARYGTGPLTGFVRCNGRSLSKSGSGGTEFASDTAQALFEYLWAFTNITLNTGKGATANADWLAGRQLNLPDLRGRTMAGMDDMGAAAAGRLTTAGFGGSGLVIGNAFNLTDTQALTAGNLPVHTHALSQTELNNQAILAGTTAMDNIAGNQITSGGGTPHQHSAFIGDDGHTHGDTYFKTAGSPSTNVGTAGTFTGTIPSAQTGVRVRSTAGNAATADDKTATEGAHTHVTDIRNKTGAASIPANQVRIVLPANTGNNSGVATPLSIVQPTMILTFYIKL